MPTVAELTAKVSVQGADKAKKDLKELKGSGGGSGSGILGLSDAFKSGLGVVSGFFAGFGAVSIATDALGFLKDQLGDVMQQAMSQQEVQAQTGAVLKSMGRSAEITAGQVGDVADSLARMSGVSDDAVQGAMNILLTFGKISGQELPQVTGLVLDLSRSFKQDLQSTAIQVGKALQDPIQGVTALKRVGVQLSTQQEDAIRHFMAVGDVAKAQGVIIGELTREVGGSSDAYGKTFPGMVSRFNVALDQAREKIGSAVLPALSDLMEKYLLPLADTLGQILPGAIQATTDFFTNTLQPAIAAFMATPLGETLQSWADSLVKNVNPAVDSSTGLSGATNNAKGSMKNLQDQAGKTGGALDPNYTKALKNVTTETNNATDATDPKGAGDKTSHALAPAMRRATDELNKLNKAQQQANVGSHGNIPVLSGLADAFGGLAQQVGDAAGQIGFLVDEIKARWPDAEPTIQQGLSAIGDSFSQATTGIQELWDGLWGTITFTPKLAFHLTEGIVTVGLDLIGQHFQQAQDDANKMVGNIKQDFIDLGASLVNILNGIADTVLGLILWPFKMAWPEAQPLLQQFGYQVVKWFKEYLPWFPGIGNLKLPAQPSTSGGGGGGGAQHKASGGYASGPTIVGEDGPEYIDLPPGSYVYNSARTQQMMYRNGATSGNAYSIVVYGADHDSALQIAREVQQQLRRRDLLAGMYS